MAIANIAFAPQTRKELGAALKACLSSRASPEISHGFLSQAEMAKAGLIQDRSYASLKWKDCFVGEEVVKYMVQHGRTSSIRETVQLGQELLTQGKFYYVGRSVDFTETNDAMG